MLKAQYWKGFLKIIPIKHQDYFSFVPDWQRFVKVKTALSPYIRSLWRNSESPTPVAVRKKAEA